MAADLDWIRARDLAVLLLLYGAGLRISEALGLTLGNAPTAGRDTLRITGKGGKERLVPILPAIQQAVARYLELCPFPLEKDEPLFRGAKGGPFATGTVVSIGTYPRSVEARHASPLRGTIRIDVILEVIHGKERSRSLV